MVGIRPTKHPAQQRGEPGVREGRLEERRSDADRPVEDHVTSSDNSTNHR